MRRTFRNNRCTHLAAINKKISSASDVTYHCTFTVEQRTMPSYVRSRIYFFHEIHSGENLTRIATRTYFFTRANLSRDRVANPITSHRIGRVLWREFFSWIFSRRTCVFVNALCVIYDGKKHRTPRRALWLCTCNTWNRDFFERKNRARARERERRITPRRCDINGTRVASELSEGSAEPKSPPPRGHREQFPHPVP